MIGGLLKAESPLPNWNAAVLLVLHSPINAEKGLLVSFGARCVFYVLHSKNYVVDLDQVSRSTCLFNL